MQTPAIIPNASLLAPLVLSPLPPHSADKAPIEYLQRLATLAKESAEAHACSSVLAGQGSEADDHGDVGLWLGTGPYDNAEHVQRALGLEGEIHFEPLNEAGLPATLKAKDLSALKKELDVLQHKYCFRDQIKVLSDLQSRLSAIRQVPASLLRQPIGNNDPFNTVRTQGAKEDFQKLRELGDEIRSDSVQKALHGARERMEADRSHLDANYRRDSRKGRRAPSPESPKPYVPADRARTSFFRLPDSDPAPPLYAEDLVRYAREFNKTQQSCRLHIWEKTRGRREDAPRILRFTIPDVLIAYLTLGYSSSDKTAIVQMLKWRAEAGFQT
ncbi:hypothetical protein H1R20_g539, partial [Candolleomyces eurysporus]